MSTTSGAPGLGSPTAIDCAGGASAAAPTGSSATAPSPSSATGASGVVAPSNSGGGKTSGASAGAAAAGSASAVVSPRGSPLQAARRTISNKAHHGRTLISASLAGAVAQADAAVEHRPVGAVVVAIGDEVADALELERLLRCGLRRRRLDVAGHHAHRVRVEEIAIGPAAFVDVRIWHG